MFSADAVKCVQAGPRQEAGAADQRVTKQTLKYKLYGIGNHLYYLDRYFSEEIKFGAKQTVLTGFIDHIFFTRKSCQWGSVWRDTFIARLTQTPLSQLKQSDAKMHLRYYHRQDQYTSDLGLYAKLALLQLSVSNGFDQSNQVTNCSTHDDVVAVAQEVQSTAVFLIQLRTGRKF